MAHENKLGLTSSADLDREEERISKKKAVELFETGLFDTLPAGKFLDYIKEKLPNCLRKTWIYNVLWILILLFSSLFLLNYYGILEVV